MGKITISYILLIISYQLCSQKFVEPGKQKQFNIVVNYDDYTVKTQMLSANKEIKINNERVYLWFGSQKIMETKGGFDGKLLHGRYNAFYLNNQLKEQGIIKYGLRHKQWKYWYPDGNLKEIITWKNGVKNGHYELYNDNGQVMAKGHFRKDKLHGKFFTYDPAGRVTESKIYKNGNEVIAPVKKKSKRTEEDSPKEEKKKEPKNKPPRKKTKKSDKDQAQVKETRVI